MIDFEAIRKRADAATPGPWKVKIHNEEYGQGYGEITYFVDIEGELLKIGLADNNRLLVKYRSDTDFIAHAREDIPYLLSQLAEQEKMHWVSVNAGADAIRQLKEWLAERDREIERTREAQRWVPVTERVPTEKDADRLGFIVAHSTSMGQSTVCVWHHILDDGVTTHWMPLPAPPEEGE